ncbi:unnamed protein product [Closterium sp. NIES-54]
MFDKLDPTEPVEVAVDSSAARGAEPAGEGTGGAELGGSPGFPLRREPVSLQRLREWYARRRRRATGAAGVGAAGGAAGAGATGGAAGVGAAGGATGESFPANTHSQNESSYAADSSF